MFCHERKNVKYTDSYDVIDLSTCFVQLLFRCYYSIGSSVECQGTVLFRGFAFNVVFVTLAPKLPSILDIICYERNLRYKKNC